MSWMGGGFSSNEPCVLAEKAEGLHPINLVKGSIWRGGASSITSSSIVKGWGFDVPVTSCLGAALGVLGGKKIKGREKRSNKANADHPRWATLKGVSGTSKKGQKM